MSSAATELRTRRSESDLRWYEGAFFEDLRILLDAADPRVADIEAQYLIHKLHLRKGKSLLDCPCGIGRISLPVAKRGIRVTGVDLTPSYLRALRGKAAVAGVPMTLIHSDMRNIRFANAFDAAANLGSSFGYFEDRADDARTVRNLYRAVKPGGRVALHTANRDWILAYFEGQDFQQVNGTYILTQRHFDYRMSILRIVWTFVFDNQRRSHELGLRLYSYHELLRLFQQAGFVDVEGYGSVKDEVVDTSRRMIWLFGRKPR